MSLSLPLIIRNPCVYSDVSNIWKMHKQPMEVFCKKSVLKSFAKFTGKKHLCWNIFLNKVADLRPATLLKKRLQRRCFFMNFPKFLRTTFLQNTPGQLFLSIHLCRYGTILRTVFLKNFMMSKFFRSSHQTCSVKKCSQKFRKIYSKSTASELQPTTLLKKRLAQKFSCKFWGIFIFTEPLRATACGSLSFIPFLITYLSFKLK